MLSLDTNRFSCQAVYRLLTLAGTQLTDYKVEGLFRKKSEATLVANIKRDFIQLAQTAQPNDFLVKALQRLKTNTNYQNATPHTWAVIIKQCFQEGEILNLYDIRVCAAWHILIRDMQKSLVNQPPIAHDHQVIRLQASLSNFLLKLKALGEIQSLQTIHAFLHFAHRTLEHTDINKMNLDNMAMVLSPCLLDGLNLSDILLSTDSPQEKLSAGLVENKLGKKAVKALLCLQFFKLSFDIKNLDIEYQDNYEAFYCRELTRLQHETQRVRPIQLSLVQSSGSKTKAQSVDGVLTAKLDKLSIQTPSEVDYRNSAPALKFSKPDAAPRARSLSLRMTRPTKGDQHSSSKNKSLKFKTRK